MSRVLPILFNTDMVRAILDGRKTVTRRLPAKRIEDKWFDYIEWVTVVATPESTSLTEKEFYEQHPPCQPGDILYVRETWCDDRQFTHDDTPGIYFYRASESDDFTTKWHPSIHMPKEAARIWLKVKDVRVERLKDIDDAGAYAEGAGHADWIYQNGARRCEFAKLWNSTIKKSDIDSYGWDANPWVWVIEFERCEKPEWW